MTDIPAPVLAQFEGNLASKYGLMRKKNKGGSQVAHYNVKSRGRMNSPLASLPNLKTELHAREVTLPAIATQTKHSSQLDLHRDVNSSM